MLPYIRRLPLALLLLPLLAGTAHAQSVIDVAVFYTPQAKDTWGGTAQIKTKIDEFVVITNMAYADSGVNQTINLVAVEEVEGYTQAAAGNATLNRYTDIRRLQAKSDGYMDEVHTIRDRVRADAVILIRQGGGGSAYTMTRESLGFASRAFGVSGTSARADTFAHELGHIMGLQHDRYVACDPDDCGLRVSADAYGYVNQRAFDSGALPSTRWRTIMASSNQCIARSLDNCMRVLYFSNPDNCYPGDCPPDDDGDPMGVARTSSNMDSTAPNGPANAARVLNMTRDTVADFRQGRAVQVSFDVGPYMVNEGGSVTGPDGAHFSIDRNGVLGFDPPPDFERPRDVGEDNVYTVTIEAADTTSLPGETLTGPGLEVTVTVEDALGRVNLPSSPPQIGAQFTARLADPDGVGVVTAWCWERSLYRDFPPADPSTLQIDCALITTATYTPVDADRDYYLRATATYTDSDGTINKEVMQVSEALVSDQLPRLGAAAAVVVAVVAVVVLPPVRTTYTATPPRKPLTLCCLP